MAVHQVSMVVQKPWLSLLARSHEKPSTKPETKAMHKMPTCYESSKATSAGIRQPTMARPSRNAPSVTQALRKLESCCIWLESIVLFHSGYSDQKIIKTTPHNCVVCFPWRSPGEDGKFLQRKNPWFSFMRSKVPSACPAATRMGT